MFSLEAVKARHGDCLLLHWGEADHPRIALIDGGPETVYAQYLAPRLRKLAKQRGVEKLKLDLTMVSHIDDDHINGVLDLADDIENGDAPAEIDKLWFNSLEGLLDTEIARGTKAQVTASIDAITPGVASEWDRKIIASVPQGQLLHAFADRQGILDLMNAPYAPIVMFSKGQKPAKIKGLTLTVLGPFADEVEELRKKWKELRKEGIAAAFRDASPYNLSSIVVMLEYDGKRALLTGDARGDKVMAGLDARGLMTDGKIHVHLLKLPHHGSQNNVTRGFFENVTADHYVVSGDHEKFPNPHENAMKWLAEARGDADYKIYCTYDLPYMREIFGERLRVPRENGASVVADLA